MSPAAVLLAGGYSRRMGRDKASLPWTTTSLLQFQAATLSATGAQPLFLSCRDEQSLSVADYVRIPDREPGGGALAALADAWNHHQADVMIVLAIDLPKMPAARLSHWAQMAAASGQSVIPLCDQRYEPLAGAWHRSSLPAVRFRLQSNQRSFQPLCHQLSQAGLLQGVTIEPDAVDCFANINQPADLRG